MNDLEVEYEIMGRRTDHPVTAKRTDTDFRGNDRNGAYHDQDAAQVKSG